MIELNKLEATKKSYNFLHMFVHKLIYNFTAVLLLLLLLSHTNLYGQEASNRRIQGLYSRITMGVWPYNALTGNLSCIVELNKSLGITSSLYGGVLKDNNSNNPSNNSTFLIAFSSSFVEYYTVDINFRLHRISKKRNIKTGIEFGPNLNHFKTPNYTSISSGWFPAYTDRNPLFTNVGLNVHCNIVFTACRFYGFNVGLRANLNEHYPYVEFELGHAIGMIKRKKIT